MMQKGMAMEFLPTVSLEATAGEEDVWNHLKEALRHEEGYAFLRYPIFPEEADYRYEPDILLLHRQWGLIVIEVKGCRVDQVTALDGHVWRMTNWYRDHEAPAAQAEKQMFALRRHFRDLTDRMRTHALVALPLVPEEEWAERGFDGLPCNPRIIHENHLTPARLRKRLQELTHGATQTRMSDDDWQLACQVLGQRDVFAEIRGVRREETGQALIDGVRASDALITAMDLDQLKIGSEIPPGPQRIRGIAGSGKTLLLAMKAARMHLSHPDWDIAFTFNTKSLYQVVREHIRRFCRHFGNAEPDWNKLRVMHAWGNASETGLYRHVAFISRQPVRSADWAAARILEQGSPDARFPSITDKFVHVCAELLASEAIQPCFDAILIDEGQDLFPEFYKIAYQALRPPKRLIWAYDEAQSLDHLRIPNAEALFGRDGEGKLLVDLAGQYPKGILKSHIMRKCYRTPAGILMPAHAVGMGLMRRTGALQMITTQQGWQAIGYQVDGAFDVPGGPIVLTRPAENCPHPLDATPLGRPLLKAEPFESREAELGDRARQIISLCQRGGAPDEVLVVFPGPMRQKRFIEADMKGLAALLEDAGIPCHIADDHPSEFRRAGAVTLSRIHRAKGNEAAFVYVVGLDRLAEDEARVESRNQLFVALTRARGICRVSGRRPKADALLEEIGRAIEANGRLTFRVPGKDGVRPLDELPDLPPVLKFETHLPLYDLRARAGVWDLRQIADPNVDWIEAPRYGDLNEHMFAVRVDGQSMEPRLPDGEIAIFQRTQGIPEGKIVLAAMHDAVDPEAVSLVVKQLIVQQQPYGGLEYRLRSENPDFEDIVLGPDEADRVRFVGVLKWGPH